MKNRYFFVHSGKHVKLGNAELRALVKTYYPYARVQNLDGRVSIVNGYIDLQQITSRIAYTKYAGKIMSMSHDNIFEPDECFKNYRKFACKLINLSKKYTCTEAVSKLGQYIKDKSPWMQVSLNYPDIIVLIVVTDNGSIVGLTDCTNIIISRDKSQKRISYVHPVALDQRLSRLMVNLTMAKENDLLLDPFCGTGSILIEASYMNLRTLGGDISGKMCYGALSNTRAKQSFIMNCDALSLPIHTKDIDVIATDLPYGRSSSTVNRSPKVLLKEFVSLINNEMKGKRCCLMCRKGDEEMFKNIVEEYDIYEHKSLTRKLMVLCN